MISGENGAFTTIRYDTDEEWREGRKDGIGASDIGAIMGLSKWKSPYEVWLEKTGRVVPEDISEKPVVKFGNDFEETAGRNYENAHPGATVRRVNAMCQSIARPHMRASLDFELKEPGKDGWGVLEVKTTRNRKDFEADLLDGYTAQVTQQLYVTGRKWGIIWAFFRDTCEYKAYPVEPDEADFKAITDAADSFWQFVTDDVAPELVGTESESRALFEQHPEGQGEWVSTGDCDLIAEEISDIDYSLKAMERDKRKLQDELKAIIGDAPGAMGGMYKVKWVRTSQSKFDRKRFEEDHPDIAAEYTHEAPRDMGLRISELKGAR